MIDNQIACKEQRIKEILAKRECDVMPDWLLIYDIDYENMMLHLVRTDSYIYLY